MLSGRGLGHTGGTLDKLEAIPGFNARLSRKELDQAIEDAGCVISTSTEGIAPADKKIYALRDVTGTVESLPLITASIMSKKLAMGASALILDVKTGSGAFMRHYQDSKALAQSLIHARLEESNHPPALGFGPVKCRIGVGLQRLHVASVEGIDGNADAQSDSQGMTIHFDVARNRIDQPVGELFGRGRFLALGRDQSEFVAAKPRNDVRRTQAIAQTVGDSDQ